MIFGSRRVNCDEMDGDRPVQQVWTGKCYMVSLIIWTLPSSL